MSTLLLICPFDADLRPIDGGPTLLSGRTIAPVFIAILDLCTAPADRPIARDQLLAERPIVRAMPGCIDFRVLEAHDDDRRLTVLHEWEDRASFDAYTQSDAFARSGDVIFPLVIEPPVSRRFDAELADVVN